MSRVRTPQAKWRKKHPERYATMKAVQNARLRAMRQLASRHREEFEKLVAAECRADGIPRTLGTLKPMEDGRPFRPMPRKRAS